MRVLPFSLSKLSLLIAACTMASLATAEPTSGTFQWKPPAVPRKDAFFGIHFDLHANPSDKALGRDATAENIGAFLDRVKPDFVQYDCKGHPGYTGYPTHVGWSAPNIVKDALALWRQETARRGVGLYIHYSGVYDAAAVAHHPEWARVDENGNRDPNATSVFGPYVDELMIPQLKEVTSAYALDGVWVDGDCWAARLDYGSTASLRWKDAMGTETLPRSRADANWQAWKDFNRKAYEDYLVKWVDALHAFAPHLELCSNWAYTPHMPLPIRAKVDFLSGDFSAKESVDRARFEARYLESTGMPWDLMAWGFNGYEHGSGPFQRKPAEQLMQEAAVVLALGGGVQVYYQPTRAGYISQVTADTAGRVADFCRARQAITHKSKAVPQVALLLSSESYLRRMENVFTPGGQYNALEGALHLLLENGYSVEMMAEHQLAPRLQEFPVVAVAQAPVLTPEFRKQLVDYANGGGAVVFLDGESARPFAKKLGVELNGKPADVAAYVGVGELTAPCPGKWQAVTTATARVAGWYTDGEAEVPGSPPQERAAYGYTTSPLSIAATVNAVGRGQMLAVYGPLANDYFMTHHPALRDWAGSLVEQVYAAPQARVLAAPHIDMSLRKLKDGRTVAELVNLARVQRAERFAALDHLPPSGPFTLEWRLDKKPASFTQLPEGSGLEFTAEQEKSGGWLCRVKGQSFQVHTAVTPDF